MSTAEAHRAGAAADDRHGLPPPAGRVPGHLDLEDPLPRGPGAARAAADAERLPALQRGRRRAPGDDPAAAARRVPAAARDPPGARLAVGRGQGAPPPPRGRARRPRRRARPRRALRARGDHLRAGPRARGVRPARSRGARAARSSTRPETSTIAVACCEARALRDLGAASAHLPHRRRPRGRAARAARRAGAALAQRRSAGRLPSSSCRPSPSWRRSSRSCSSGATSGTLGGQLSGSRRSEGQDPRRARTSRSRASSSRTSCRCWPTRPRCTRRRSSWRSGSSRASPTSSSGRRRAGFILGAALAYKLGCGFVAARRPGEAALEDRQRHLCARVRRELARAACRRDRRRSARPRPRRRARDRRHRTRDLRPRDAARRRDRRRRVRDRARLPRGPASSSRTTTSIR